MKAMRAWILLAVAVLVPVAAWAILAPATRWLASGEPPVPSDLLVVLGGGSGERLETGLDLYRAGLAPAILITDRLGFPDRQMRYLVQQGVPERAVIPSLRPAASTFEDALAVGQVVARRNLKSVLVVTSPYHCRRARLVFHRILGGSGVRVTVTPSTVLYMDMAHWWRSRQGWITVPIEFPKLLWAWATVPTVTDVGADRASK